MTNINTSFKKVFFSFICLMAFCALSVTTGCQTSNAFKVPGESSIITKNIASEYFTIAEGYADLKKYDKAAEYYKYAMKNKSLRLSAYYKMARCYALAKDYKNALEAYEKLLKLDPDNKEIKLSLAYIQGMSGNTEKALNSYEVLMQEFPEDSSVLVNYINVLIYIGRVEDAEKYLKILIEKFPDCSEIKTLSDSINSQIDNPDSNLGKKEENQEKSN